jgi:hypothetical protein
MSLNNENILKYHDNFIEDGMFCITTEYCSVYFYLYLYIYTVRVSGSIQF